MLSYGLRKREPKPTLVRVIASAKAQALRAVRRGDTYTTKRLLEVVDLATQTILREKIVSK